MACYIHDTSLIPPQVCPLCHVLEDLKHLCVITKLKNTRPFAQVPPWLVKTSMDPPDADKQVALSSHWCSQEHCIE